MLEGLRHLIASGRPLTEVLRDVVDILIVAFIMYRALLVLKGTRAMQMGIGFVAFGVLYLVAKHGELATLMSVLSWLASSAILVVVVVFQNDIRRALIRVGQKAWFSRGHDAQQRVIDEVVAASTELARHRMGALMCLERDANVLEFVKSDGITLDAEVTRELLVSLFIPEAVNKTHDGAVLIRNLKISRAGMFLPMPETTKVADPTLGSRHRAAIGITEETDCVVIVVSEERGTITLCFPNGMVQNVDGASLQKALMGLFGRGEATKKTASLAKRLAAGVRSDEEEARTDKTAKTKSSSATKTSSKSDNGQSGKHSALKSSTSTSGRYEAVKREDASKSVSIDRSLTPAPGRVSIPMPSAKDRKAPSDPPDAPDADESKTSPQTSVTKPMAQTELHARPSAPSTSSAPSAAMSGEET